MVYGQVSFPKIVTMRGIFPLLLVSVPGGDAPHGSQPLDALFRWRMRRHQRGGARIEHLQRVDDEQVLRPTVLPRDLRSPAKEFIVGTEMGILYRLRKENPGKRFHIASRALLCPNMKLTTLEDVRDALLSLSPVITVPEGVRVRAKAALDAMLAVPRDAA